MSDQLPACPKCASEYVYQDQNLLICPECAHEWDPNQADIDEDAIVLKDAVGNLLAEGDKVTVVKDLKVKGTSTVIKVGTKATIKRFLPGDHDIDCKVDGSGDMLLKSSVVKKA
ncbi:zinc ribbon domain-containing protein YjdM [Catenovulum maritimum]|uniref:Alkylphosphonate utilization protein n=1 Tax=Catenovulum maritimum TaxID=1513271 RepID=A0A0J8GQE0_9ALTE|nr:zinc ribbon domain-containing protein YjdM [Catenovulum maritimum]KMT64990.1 alkylphosphonate utilization protein [Catenovulum maritimum]